MKTLKYVVAKVGYFDQPFVFGELITHADFATQCGFTRENIVGAGFVCIAEKETGEKIFEPYGESVSLKIGTTPEAVEAFDRMFNAPPF